MLSYYSGNRTSKRVIIFRNFVIFFIFVMLVKFFIFGIVRGEEFEDAANRQRVAGTSLSKIRGTIYDRNMIPITNRDTNSILCLIPSRFSDNKEAVKDIADILNISQSVLLASLEGKLPVFLELTEDQKQVLSSKYNHLLSFINVTERYTASSVAPHVVGYIRQSDEVGQTGVEKYFEDYISSDLRQAVVAVYDAKSQPIKGFGYKLSERGLDDEPLNVVLTIDYHIQKICEEVLKNKNAPGAIVVQDISNGDIVAMASSPDFDPNNVAAYLNSEDNELVNKATSAYNIGSVFKIILAAIAFEREPELNYSYLCNGSYQVDGLEFLCHAHRHGGHGILDLKSAFAQSCNTYFIDLGLTVGMEDIIEMARRLGLGEVLGLANQGISESAGNIPPNDMYFSQGDIANVSIGQGEILVTPLQAANLLTTIANDGVAFKPNIVKGLSDKDGNIVEHIKFEQKERVLKVSVAQKLKELLSEVVISGTAQGLQRFGLGGVGGKTGSAETGAYDENGKQIVHSWFAGYFPTDKPQYTISVFVENGATISIPATEVFGEVASRMIKNKLVIIE